jgi:acyl transferase domain-containing protein/NAD(P)-dependent dehydrogenase (short-subunit alcohol dehydrogenase family)
MSVPEPLAVIGLSCLFPQAHSVEEFWSNIRRGVDAIGEIPATHWDPAAYFAADPKTPDMTYAQRGGFLSPVAFDPLEFGIAPSNLEAIDTSQLLGLVAAKRALADAGYGEGGKPLGTDRAACILGVTGALEMVIPLGARLGHPKWRRALQDSGVAPDVADDVIERIASQYVPWQENSFPGLLGNVVAGRIANRFDLHGTNCVVDAACASSLSAIHLAALELWSGRADVALTGGIDTFNDIFMYMCFSKTPALSASGDARPFADAADGTILGEGVGMLVLKRLSDAERDGDRILALIRGIGTSSDGSGSAVYAPKKEGQVRCLIDAYTAAGVDPQTVELVEAHGTGTKVGDATEVQGLCDVFGKSANRTGRWCTLGSVKSQIGHTKAAAGAAGLVKAILALHHRVLPPTLKVDRPQDALLAEGVPFAVNRQARPWLPRAEHPRRAGVSAFGFGGSNFHCVLEESPAARRQTVAQTDWDSEIVLWSASGNTVGELSQALDTLQAAASDWTAVRHVSAQQRQTFQAHHPERLAMVLERGKSDIAALVATVKTAFTRYADRTSWSTPDGVFYGKGSAAGRLAVLFPGQGAQSVGMLRELACRFPVMQDVLTDADAAFAEFRPDDARRLSDYIYPPTAYTAEDQSQQEQSLRTTDVAQPALGAVSLGALAVLNQFGVRGELTAGHSYGELTALCASGRMSPTALYRLSLWRGRLMSEVPGEEGGMLAVGAPLAQVELAIREAAVDLVIANRNGPNQVVLSGRLPEIERATELFARRNIPGKRLPVAAAFHSPLVAAASERFRPVLDDVAFEPGRVPVYANSSAVLYPDDPASARDVLARQLAQPVEFVKQIENMYAAGARTFLEVGPGNTLTGLVGSILSGRDHRAIAVDHSAGKRVGLWDLAATLAQLAAAGHPVDLSQWDPTPPTPPDRQRQRMTVPLSGANYVKPRTPKPPRIAASASNSASSATSPFDRSTPQAATTAAVQWEELAAAPASAASMVQASPTNRAAATQPRATPPAATLPAAVPPASTPSGLPLTTLPLPRPMEPSMPVMSTLSTMSAAAAPVSARSSAGPGHDGLWQLLAKMQTETAELHRQFLHGQELALQALLSERQRSNPSLPINSVTPIGSVTQSAGSPTVPAPSPWAAMGTPSAGRPDTNWAAAFAGPPAAPLVAGTSVDRRSASAPVQPGPAPAWPPTPTPTPAMVAPPAGGLATPRSPAAPSPPVSPASVSTPALAPAALAPTPTQPAATSQLTTSVLAVVAEKTGYPVEMLQPSMSLDHDLGIDSIKRVEILSTLQERFPDLPSVTPEQLQTLHRLSDVIALLGPASVPAVLAPTTTPPAAVHPAVTHPAATSQLTTSVLAVVAEKTGYPVEMLQPSMSLDHDLGIDSIKRVEILSTLQERFPDLPSVTPEQLQTLHRLSDVIALLGPDSTSVGRLTTGPSPSPTASSATSVVAAGDLASSSTSDLTPAVLAVVAEKTGYPVEMLQPSMSLDHDLGIDSIKRVEILSTLQERFPDLPSVTPEQLQTLHRLSDVIALLGPTSSANSAAFDGSTSEVVSAAITARPAVTAPTKPSTDVAALQELLVGHVHVVPAVVNPATRPPLRFAPQSEFWITNDGGELSLRVAKELTNAGFRSRLVDLEDPTSPAPQTPLSGLVLLTPETGCTEQRLWKALEWVQRCGPSLKRSTDTGDALIASVSRLDGAHGFDATTIPHDPFAAGLSGLVKTVRHEWARVVTKAIDCDPRWTSAVDAAAAIVQELLHAGPVEVGLSAAGRQVVQITSDDVTQAAWLAGEPNGSPASNHQSLGRYGSESAGADVTRSEPVWRPGDVVLVTGGARGVTASAARELGRVYGVRLVLLGRHPHPVAEPDWLAQAEGEAAIKQALARSGGLSSPKSLQQAYQQVIAQREILQTLQECRSLGIDVQYSAVDVRDISAVCRVVAEIEHSWGPIRGLVHGAGVLADQRIEDKTREQYSRVFGTKVSGLQTLLGALPPDQLRGLVLFSSFTGRFGRTGQVDYAMANEVLNKLGQQVQRQQSGCRVVSFNWGPWDGGMVQGGLKSLFAHEGIGLIPVSSGAALVAAALRRPASAPIEVVVLGPGTRWRDSESGWDTSRQHPDHQPGSSHSLGDSATLGDSVHRTGRGTFVGPESASFPSTESADIRLAPSTGGVTSSLATTAAAASTPPASPRSTTDDSAIHVDVDRFDGPPIDAITPSFMPPANGTADSRGVPPTMPPASGAHRNDFEFEDLAGRPLTAMSDRSSPSTSAAAGSSSVFATAERPGPTLLSLVAWEREVTLDRWPCLASHVIGGKAVVPVALLVEWMAQAALHRNPGLEFQGVDDFKILKGMRLQRGDAIPMQVLLGKPLRVAGELRVPAQVVSRSPGRTVLHASGEIALGNSLPSAPALMPAPEPNSLPATPAPVLASGQIYERLFHGPAFHGLSSIVSLTPTEIVGQSRISPPATEWGIDWLRPQWVTDPLVLDGVLQLAIVWCLSETRRPCLPSGFRQYRQYRRRFPRDGVQIGLHMRHVNEHLLLATAEITDAAGQLVARVEETTQIIDASLASRFRERQLPQ